MGDLIEILGVELEKSKRKTEIEDARLDDGEIAN